MNVNQRKEMEMVKRPQKSVLNDTETSVDYSCPTKNNLENHKDQRHVSVNNKKFIKKKTRLAIHVERSSFI